MDPTGSAPAGRRQTCSGSSLHSYTPLPTFIGQELQMMVSLRVMGVLLANSTSSSLRVMGVLLASSSSSSNSFSARSCDEDP